jgi:uroporphyrinogen III methyltransferase/synthase
VRVVVTRAEVQAEPLVSRLASLGHEVVRCPLIRVEPIGDDPLDLSSYDWVVVTSPNGAGEIARRLTAAPRHFAAIGPATAEALRGHGHEPDLVARVHTQEGLRDELPQGRTLLAAAEGARQGVIDADFLPLYRTVELTPPAPEGDVALIASASAARGLAATGARLPVVSIGPQTTQAARDAGFDVIAEATTHDLEGLLAALQSL